MKRLFYPRLAITNIKKNAKTYIPYILTCVFTVALFYIISSITINPSLQKVYGGPQLATMLSFGVAIIGIFSCIFLFYTNSFLIKRRKKEIALYNILGMDKKHIMKMLGCETIFTSIFSLSIGIGTGILLSKLVFLLLLNIANIDTTLSYVIPISSIYTTCILFIGIFVITLGFNMFQIHIANPIELLSDNKNGEKEPKSKWLLTLFGFASLGAGYYLSVTIISPLDAISMFFVAVLLVILGTYALFISGSVTILKMLKKKKKLYYQTKYFTAISGMIYRMKQNAVGLANICILSTCVIVVLSTTTSLFLGTNDAIENRYTYDATIQVSDLSTKNTDNTNINNIDKIARILAEEKQKYNVEVKDILAYHYIDFPTLQDGTTFTPTKFLNNSYSDLHSIGAMTLEQYNTMQGTNVVLKPNEILYYQLRATNEAPKTIILGKQEYAVKAIEKPKYEFMNELMTDQYLFVLPNQEAFDLLNKTDVSITKAFTFYFNMNSNEISDNDSEFMKSIATRVRSEVSGASVEIKQVLRDSLISTFGGLFFVGIFFGIQFLMAVALIIYYKQISEGYDDAERYKIMQKVGMSKKEVKNSINSQILLVFFLPLIIAVIHFSFAFPMVYKLLALLSLTNISLFMICSVITIVAFTIIYAGVYYITSKLYYKIVN